MAKQGAYTFYPYVRQGIAANIEQKDNFNNKSKLKKGGGRATYSAAIKLTATPVADNESAETIEQEKQKRISMFGPGEVIGINRRAIIRTEPRNNITNFEPHHLAFIDFYDEDFPWRYTPASPLGEQKKEARLRPWLVLVICEEQQKGDGWDIQLPSTNELESNEGKTVMLPYLERKTADIAFPPPGESWAWAHVHANRVDTGTKYKYGNLEELIDKAPNRACSRLFCATRLKENTSYHAFLLPAFEQGRLAGLGADSKEIYSVPAQLASWDDNHQTPEGIRIGEAPPTLDSYKNKWPIYHQWYFKTGKAVDFEYLVRLLEPRVLDERVGTRPLDISSPGWGLKYNHGTGTVFLQGAMKRPGQEPEKFLGVNTNEHDKFTDDLSNILNLNYANTFSGQTLRIQLQNSIVDFFGKEANTPDIPNLDAPDRYDDPIITPPLYGRFHALKHTINKSDEEEWFKEVNLDPGMRAVAGLGARVVQKKQEEYMHRAWLQVERIIKANKARNKRLWGKQLSQYTKRKYLDGLDSGKFLNMTFKLHSMLKLLPSELIALRGINHFLLPTFTRIARPGGPRFKSLNIAYTGVSVSATYNLDGMVNIIQIASTIPSTIANTGGLDTWSSTTVFDTSIGIDPTLFPGGAGNIPLGNISNIMQRNTGPGNTNQRGNQNNPVMRGTANMRMRTGGAGEEEEEDQAELLNSVAGKVKARIDPENSFPRKMDFMLSTIDDKQSTTANDTQQSTPTPKPLTPVMAHPKFPEPIYEALNDLSQDFLLPNIHLIQPNTVALLETNQAFIEAYMLGVNHEMARELYWREYPTDRRGTYFRQFWDVEDVPGAIDDETGEVDEKFKDIKEINTWDGALGTNKPGDPDPDNLVLVIRGELLKKFPNAYIYMRKAVGIPGKRVLSESEDVKLPIFEVNVEPDIFFIGFDISEEEAKGNPGWFIVIEERPGEIRFGFDLPAENPVLNTTDDLDWGVMKVEEGNAIDLSKAPPIKNKEWAHNAAHIAKALYQKPYRAAIHASVMIP